MTHFSFYYCDVNSRCSLCKHRPVYHAFFPSSTAENIVSRGDWLWNSANFKGRSLCLRFGLVTWSRPCTTEISRWRPEFRRNRTSNQKFWLFAVKFAVDWSSIVMPGDNCSVFGCGTSRRTKGVGIWKLPKAKDEDHKKCLLKVCQQTVSNFGCQ